MLPFFGFRVPRRAEYLRLQNRARAALVQCLGNINTLVLGLHNALLHAAMVLPLLHNLLRVNTKPRTSTSTFGLNPPNEKRLHSSSAAGFTTGPLHGCVDLAIRLVNGYVHLDCFRGSEISITPHICLEFLHRGDLFLLLQSLRVRTNHELHHDEGYQHQTGKFRVVSESCTFSVEWESEGLLNGMVSSTSISSALLLSG